MTAELKNDLRPAKWRDVFALDLRSLALFRILAGLIILADLAFRFSTLTTLCTDAGYFNRKLAGEYFNYVFGESGAYAWSLYWICGQAWWYYTLFGLAAIFAVLLVVGYRTRIATIGSWLLLVSLHTANPLLITSGDTIFRLILLWCIFLPLGRVWSLDAKRNQQQAALGKSNDWRAGSSTVLSIASACFIVQFMIMYFFTGYAKCNEEWFSGVAMQYVLRLNIYVLPLGRALLQYPLLLKFVAYTTLFAEVVLIWCLLIPWKNGFWRGVVMATFFSFHIAIGLTLEIGLFSIICLSIWLAFLPTRFWDWLLRRRNARPNSPDMSASYSISTAKHLTQFAAGLFCAGVMTFTLVLNIAHTNPQKFSKLLPSSINPMGMWLGLDQRFQMFGRPPKVNPWFVYEATLANGKFVNPMQPEPISQTDTTSELHVRPANHRRHLPTFHWRKTHRNLVDPLLQPFRAGLAECVADKWNSEHSDSEQIVHMKIVCHLQSTDPNHAESFEETSVWATYGDAQQADSAVEAKVDSIFDQLLEEDNPDSPPF